MFWFMCRLKFLQQQNKNDALPSKGFFKNSLIGLIDLSYVSCTITSY